MDIPLRIVLVETSHPGNIGAAARAMKTMGVTDLALVRPKVFPNAEATARASGADDVLARARVVQSLAEAIAECTFVVGASARLRAVPWPVVDPRSCAHAIWEHLQHEGAAARAAIVVGPEHSGLTNEDLGRCRQLVHIPADPAFSSLNLAMAVQVLAYEVRMASMASMASPSPRLETGPMSAASEPREAPLATAGELEGLHAHLERVLTAAGFLHPDHPHQLRLKLRRIFHRAALDRNEINILRGALAALDPERAPAGARRTTDEAP